jgi:hypothetical protein
MLVDTEIFFDKLFVDSVPPPLPRRTPERSRDKYWMVVVYVETPFKGHGNEADFPGFLQKSVRHRFLTLHFEQFRFGLRIRRDIRNRKTTPRLAESGSRQECL